MAARKTQGFRWTENRTKAALALAKGTTKVAAAKEAGVNEATVYAWLRDEEFSNEVDRLTLITDYAKRAERVRIGKRAVDARMIGDHPLSKKDLLDWLKYIQSETDGEVVDLSRYLQELARLHNLDPDNIVRRAEEIAARTRT